MAPAELSYSLNGVFQKRVIAEDGIQAILETPAGTASAKFRPNGHTLFTREPAIDRLGVRFPGDPEFIPYSTRADGLHYHINSLFDFLFRKERAFRRAEKVWREKTISTADGKVAIKAVGYDAPPTG